MEYEFIPGGSGVMVMDRQGVDRAWTDLSENVQSLSRTLGQICPPKI